MGVEARCDCLSESVKQSIMKSNLPDDIKDEFMRARTCGAILDSDVITIIRRAGYIGSLREIIPEMRKYGLTKPEISDKLLEMHSSDKIYLERGLPIGVTGEELEDITISTPTARYAYAKVRKGR